MQPTSYTAINELLDVLLSRMRAVIGTKLVGLYLNGSLVIGDFDPQISDIDLIAVLSSDVDEREFQGLREMHTLFTAQHKDWDNRIEVRYVSVAALNAADQSTGKIASISPGEPFNRRELSAPWLIDWYLLRERGVVLFGPSPGTIVEPISKEKFVQIVAAHAQAWREWVQHTRKRKAQAYAILSCCRALHVCSNGEQVSKKKAATWAQEELPEWSGLIQQALLWREARDDQPVDHEATYPETVRFVDFVSGRVDLAKQAY